MRTKSIRALCAVTLVLTTGCQTWQPRTQSPTVVIQEEQPERVRLRSVEDESWLVLRDPRVQADSIAGLAQLEPRSKQSQWGPFSVPVASVDRVEVRSTDEGATVVLLLGLAALTALIVAVNAECSDSFVC